MSTRAPSSVRRIHRLALSAVVAATLACGVVAGEQTASAQVIAVAPPAVRVEVMGRPPSPAHFWIPGYWGWHGTRHVWVGGRWEHSRPGWGYSNAHWAHEGRGWRLAPGHWHRR